MNTRFLPALAAATVLALPLAIAGCGSGADTASTTDPPPSTAPTGTTSGGLILDYTAYIEGAEQISGLAVSGDGFDAALVTDFEKVIIYDLDDGEVEAEFPVPLSDLPQQGSTEAITFTGDDELAVLYPEDALIRRYSADGEMLGEHDISELSATWFGAMTATGQGREVALITDGPEPQLVRIDLDEAGVSSSVPLMGVDTAGLITGLSRGIDGEMLWVGTDQGENYPVDSQTGKAGAPLSTPEVGEPSAIELLVNTEGERVIAVADDDDRFNGSEGPILLHLLPE